MSKILGMDYGSVRIGLALGDEEQKIALPFDVIANNEGVVGNLRRIIDAEKVYRIVIGLPLNMSGVSTKKTEEVEDFIDLLKSNFNLPILTEDERLSSKMADSLFKDFKQKYDRDAIAAMIILQGYLDKIK
ncbi:MAG: Holliday junction resolvase RuvX [Patescibacteria group bacterium]|jgi:putative Holliday junction resolvase